MSKLKNKDRIGLIAEVSKDDGSIPNNNLPLLIYKAAFTGGVRASDFEAIFEKNNWKGSWRNGIYSYHHYHSTSHEVLGIYAGSAEVQFGGPGGLKTKVRAGDVIIIPAGVGHKNLGSSSDFACVGAYPDGRSYDTNYGKEGERPETDKNIANVPLPDYDPLYGSDGVLQEKWKR